MLNSLLDIEIYPERGYIQISYKEQILHDEDGEALEEVAQRSGCLIPGSLQGETG